MNKSKLLILAASLLFFSCEKNDSPSPDPDSEKQEALFQFSFNSESRDICEMAYRLSEDNVMFVFRGDEKTETLVQFGLKSVFIGRENKVEDIYHNDDYLFFFEDKDYLYTQYHALKSGTIYVCKLEEEDNWDIKLDLVLPEGSSFLLSYQGKILRHE
ncbi:MAG: hypothetical protein ACI3ZF_00915 [Candidatus Cryptobacteroides sp.]